MERRVLLAITLSFLVLFLFQRFVMPPPAPVPSAPAATPNQNASATSPAGSPAAPAPGSPASPASPVSPATPASPAIAATVSEANVREIVVETSKIKAVFSNRGGKIVHWILKEYRTDAGQPLGLVPGGAGTEAIKPFTVTVDDQAVDSRLNDAVYRVTVNGNAAGET